MLSGAAARGFVWEPSPASSPAAAPTPTSAVSSSVRPSLRHQVPSSSEEEDDDEEPGRRQQLRHQRLRTSDKSHNSSSRKGGGKHDHHITNISPLPPSDLLDNLFLQHLIMCYRCFHFAFITLPRMLLNAVRLILFVLCLLPGFVQFAYYYFFVADRVSVRYGSESKRQTLDVYRCGSSSSNNNDGGGTGIQEVYGEGLDHRHRSSPVVVFCPGGAWLIGYKMWGALTARALSASGIVVVVPDYRNYPWTTVPGMVHDVSVALQYTLDHVHEYGGDPSQVVVVGQSAGGHLAFTALLRQALGRCDDEGGTAAEGSTNLANATRMRQPEGSTGGALSSVRITSGELVVGAIPSSPSSQSSASSTSTTSSLAGHPPPLADEEADNYDEVDRHHHHEEEEEAAATRALMNASDATGFTAERLQRPPLWTWEATDFKGLITLSAPFDLAAMSRSFQKHGLDKHIVDRIFGADVNSYDPRSLLESAAALDSPIRLPPMRVFHGEADKTVPSCDEFCDVLRQRLQYSNSGTFSYTTYPNWSHTDAIIEGPMMANHTFHRDVFDAVREWTGPPYNVAPAAPSGLSSPATSAAAAAGAASPPLEWPDDNHPALRPLCPTCLVHLGRFFMPF